MWEAELPEKANNYAGNIPGRILGKRDGCIEVLTGNGVLRLKQLQYDGEEEKNALDIPISVKDTFGK